MAELTLDVTIANQFISSLSKSLQALCHGCMEFDSGIEIVGYINVNIDSGSKVDYVLNERVHKSTGNTVQFVSNSFVAKKDKPKEKKDVTCSPVRELQGDHHYQNANLLPHLSPSQSSRGRKRSLQGRDWKDSHGKLLKPISTKFSPSSRKKSSAATTPTLPATDVMFDDSVSESAVDNYKIKREGVEGNTRTNECDLDDSSAQYNHHNDQCLEMNIKIDPDAASTQFHNDSFFQSTSSNSKDTASFANQSTSDSHSSLQYTSHLSSYHQNDETLISDLPVSFNNSQSEMSDLKVSFNSAQANAGLNSSHGEATAHGESFECIQIGDEEEEEFQALFGGESGENRPTSFSCNYCGKVFANKYKMLRHARIHSGHRPHECQECGKTFGRKEHLTRHLQTHLPTEEKIIHRCHLCLHQYNQRESLKYHLKSHHGIVD